MVIFGGDYSFNAPAFTLMGQTTGILTQDVPLVSPGRAEVEDEVPIGLP